MSNSIDSQNFVPACVSMLIYKSKNRSKVPLTLVTAAQSDKIENKEHRNTECVSVY